MSPVGKARLNKKEPEQPWYIRNADFIQILILTAKILQFILIISIFIRVVIM